MKLPKELRSLVSQSVALLGQVIQHELGPKGYQRVEDLRVSMTELRQASAQEGIAKLRQHYEELAELSSEDQEQMAKSFTLMLELMNSCENAYRSHRLTAKSSVATVEGELPQAIIYVLTAHPTEARSPQNIEIFHQIQNLLIEVLDRQKGKSEISFSAGEKNKLLHYLGIAWRTPVVRSRSPNVKDEAEHIYSLLFRNDVLFSLIDREDSQTHFYVRSWVGGDKDGHPGVDEKVLLQSLHLSRRLILKVILSEISLVKQTLELFPSSSLQKQLSQIDDLIQRLKNIKTSDAKTIQAFRQALNDFKIEYQKVVGSVHPQIQRISQVNHTFPALVVPLELREASNVLMASPKDRPKLAIYKMLSAIERISRGGDPRWYARGFIISMTESIDHIRAAAQFQNRIFDGLRIPIIPLFEEASSLAESDQIMLKMTKDKEISKAAHQYWGNKIEMMVGYSDSAKEAGVLKSRVSIAEALPKLEKVCQSSQFTPIFFHGSGGSIDRGGGSIEDQTAWWPKSALRYYKVTIQGEMVERSLASPAIARRQIASIRESATKEIYQSTEQTKNPDVEDFADKVADFYRRTTTSPEFLKMVEAATPYSYLNVLKIGSRPSKRTTQLTVKGLRAIPWVLCWTQTRVLFPTWWGIGTSWQGSSPQQKESLKRAFKSDPVFTSYIKALGFTLAKVEMNIWKIYLEQSGLSATEIQKSTLEFEKEFDRTIKCYQEICAQKNLMWFRPWLGDSIVLRSSMIHPLNLLQIIAKQSKNLHLLRVTVTGISSGMLTTG